MKVAQYPLNADRTPMDLMVGVLTDATGNGGARLTSPPTGPDSAPIDAKGIILVDKDGNPIDLSGSGALTTPNRASLAAISSLSDGSVRFVNDTARWFTFSTNNFVTLLGGSLATIDPLQGIYVAPASDPTGASGAWVHQFKGRPHADWFGAVANDILGAGTNCGAIFAQAYATALALAQAPNIFAKFSPGLEYNGYYYLGSTKLDIKHFFPMVGGGSGMAGGAQTQLRWDAGTSGIRLHYDDLQTYDSSGSPIRGTALVGGWNGSNEGEFHAIETSVRFPADDLVIHDWQGDAINGITDASISPKTNPGYGNSNGASLRRIRVYNCRDAVNVQGGDANVWFGSQIDIVYVRRWGIDDRAFLGNVWDVGQVAVAGIAPGTYTPCSVSYSGIWFCVIDGQEVGASTNAPPATYTRNQWWVPFDTGAPNTTTYNVPAWVSGMTLRSGGPCRANNANSTTHFRNFYVEGGCPAVQLNFQAQFSGQTGAPVLGARTYASKGMFTSADYMNVENSLNNNQYHQIGPGSDGSLMIDRLTHPTFAPSGLFTRWSSLGEQEIWMTYASGAGEGDMVWQQSGPFNTTSAWGPGRMNYPFGFGLGGKKVRPGTAAPTTGAWLVGDLVINTAVSAGAPWAWRCISAGTPGTWEQLGGINTQSVASAATVTPTFDNDLVKITAQAAALNLANPTGTAKETGIAIRIKDNGTARAITYGTQYRAIGVTLPTTTVVGKTLYLGMNFNADDTKWDVVAVAQEA
jgi:hypothetical protein